MKAKKIITLSSVVYVLSLIGIVVGTHFYINDKRNLLRKEAYETLDNFFSRQKKYVNIGYSGEKVAYEETIIPHFKSFGSEFENQRRQKWEEQYGDIYKMYKLKQKYVSVNKYDTDVQWTGWLLYIIERNGWGEFVEYLLFPYQVGFKIQSDSWMYNYMPSVQTAVNEAFEFHTTDTQSSYSKFMTHGSGVSVWEVKNVVCNEYYKLFSYDDWVEIHGKHYADSLLLHSPWSRGDQYFSFAKVEDNQMTGGSMSNDYYRVYHKCIPLKFWSIAYDIWNDPQTKDRNKILSYLISIISFLFVLILIPFLIKARREDKIKTETLKETLLRVCSPSNYTKPFIKEKVEIANQLYARVLGTESTNNKQLKLIRRDAESSLGIDFINAEEKQKLINLCNPNKYMVPYIEEKVKLATELYSTLLSENINIDTFEAVKEQSQALIKNV